MVSFPKIVKSALLGLVFTGLVSTTMNAREIPQIALIAAFVIPAVSAYIALTQDEQPVLHSGSDFEKFVNWYRRVICGKASKKTQVLQPDGEIKDVYSKSSGIFGKIISWYEANEKDVKKAVGIGAIPVGMIAGWLTFNNIQEFLVAHALKAPWGGEGFAKMPVPYTSNK